MTGPKLNEKATEVATSTKAVARYVRVSAYKAREVLDLIRGLDVRRADEVLAFTTRDVARDVRKVLASAVANAVNNDGQDVDELFVLACFADEGPTMKRFRPRARGRGTRIRKRSCHITVIVARLDDDRLEVVQGRRAGSAGTGRRAASAASSRRDRVARSRARAESLRDGGDETTADTTTDTPAVQGFADVSDAETDAADEAALPAGAIAAPADGSVPEGYPIKGNASSMKYHVPEGRYYEATIAEVYFDTVEHAEAAGYDAPATDEAAVEEFAETETEAPAAQPQGFAVTAAPAEGDEGAEALPDGAAAPLADGSAPDGFPIKGNASSKKYHVPGGRYFDVTVAELYFDSPESAEAAGYEQPAADQENN